MIRTVIFGNSGSGKSTLAKHWVNQYGAAHLDLDTVAWLPTTPPERMPLAESADAIHAFIKSHPSWVIEGCYADLIAMVADQAEEMVFMNLPVSECIRNAESRPWEPHKYPSKEAQDANLPMLIDWIKQYEIRDDAFSQKTHQALYDQFKGQKVMYTANEKLTEE